MKKRSRKKFIKKGYHKKYKSRPSNTQLTRNLPIVLISGIGGSGIKSKFSDISVFPTLKLVKQPLLTVAKSEIKPVKIERR